jgi:hypothetical protein
VERLGDEHRIDRPIGERDRLGGALEHVAVELRPHAGIGLDRDDVREPLA